VLWRNGRHDLGKASKQDLARKLVALIAESYAAAASGGVGVSQRGSALAK
jgi:hypothetical protein